MAGQGRSIKVANAEDIRREDNGVFGTWDLDGFGVVWVWVWLLVGASQHGWSTGYPGTVIDLYVVSFFLELCTVRLQV